MPMINCLECGKEISALANNCPDCGVPVEVYQKYEHKSLTTAINDLKNKETSHLEFDKLKILKWFALVNGAIILTIILLFQTLDIGVIIFFLLIGSIAPVIMLLISKWLAIKSHKIRLISKDNAKNDTEKQLVEVINILSTRAGLDTMPDVGIYDSQDMNAFATGKSRNDSLIAFSSSLLNKMDASGISAVAAHEMAHIANGDMLTMTILQAAINALILIIMIPLEIYRAIASDDNWIIDMIFAVVNFIITVVLLFVGNLILKAFSRHREFEADRCAAQMFNAKSMIVALKTLQGQEILFPPEQKDYAAFKISAPLSFVEWFSTHPAIERRIENLENLQKVTY